MSSVRPVEFKCSQCGAATAVEVYDSINVGTDPTLKEQVKNGSLFIWECPHCGCHNLAQHPVLYHDPDNKLMVWFSPEKIPFTEEQEKLFTEELKEYTLRRTRTLGSLIEKISIHDAGLDDIVVEMCKYVTKMELADKAEYRNRIEELLDFPFKFYCLNGADHEIELSFPEKGEMKVLNIGFNVYEDCKRILDRNPSIQLPTGFAEIDAEWLSTVMR